MERRNKSGIVLVVIVVAILTFYLNSLIAVPTTRTASEVVSDLSASRYFQDVKYLSRDEMKGRGDGSPELDKAAEYIASQFRTSGLRPMGDNKTYLQAFQVTTGAAIGTSNELELGGRKLRINEDFVPITFSNSAAFDSTLVFAGYGISAPELHYDDYQNINATGKIVIVLRHEPQELDPKSPFDGTNFTRHASFVNKAINAKQHGAQAIVFITDLNHEDEQVGAATRTEETDDLGIPAAHAKRDFVITLLKTSGKDLSAIQKKIDSDLQPQSFDLADSRVHMRTDIVRTRKTVKNVVAAIPGSDPALQHEWVVIGAHYDHLGLGDRNSLAPSQVGQIHHGADDNASGTSGVLEIARLAAKNKNEWKRSILFITFAGEEIGLLGSSHFVNHPTVPLKDVVGMINMDMIGRLNNDRLFVGGVGTSPSFKSWLEEFNKAVHLQLDYSDSGYGASDHMSFNSKKIPVLFFFSGLHTDYHKPSDTFDKINANGAVKVLSVVYMMADKMARDAKRPEYTEVQEPKAAAGSGGGYGPYFGSVPDFRDDLKGVLFADVQNNSPAAKAGLKQGDLLTAFDGKPIENLYDFTYALRAKQAGDVVEVVVKRNGQELKVNVTLEARK
jgi:peptidase M28-like protein/PDZ domain-containing protein/PA domain-containing protein